MSVGSKTAKERRGRQVGFFTANELNVTYLQILNSPAGFASLLSGQYDIVTATIDNAVNYRFNLQNVSVLGQLDQGPDPVVASVPAITSIRDRGSRSCLYGLVLGTNYCFDTEGATALRYQYLVNGSIPSGTPAYATILTYPFTAEGLALPPSSHPNVLARASNCVNPFSSTTFTATTASTMDATKGPLLTQFLTAMLEANQYLVDPKKKACAIDAIAVQLNASTLVAIAEYAAATDVETGEKALMQGGVFHVSGQGLLNVIDVRSQFGGFSGAPAGFDFADAIVPGQGKLID
ncbi:MAG: hypothetical protein Q9218_001672 [Villophora microphyllina]